MAEPVPPGPPPTPAVAELRRHIARLADGWPRPRRVDGVTVFSTTRTTAPLGGVAEPVLALVAQGAKRSMLGDRTFDYAAGQFLVVTVDLPLTSSITAASAAEPFLALSMPLDAATIAELLIEADLPAQAASPGPALSVSDAAPELTDAVVRFLRLVGTPRDLRILGPAVKREIHWRLLTGPQGGLVRQAGTAGSRIALVARAIAWIRAHYDEPIRVDDLAAEVGLSVSSLNRHFRAATSMSPLQYQKQLRLQRARLRLLADPADVAGTGHAVGYTSASQFSREYRRLFGVPPGRDAAQLQNASLAPD
ncbi:MAG TPA: AraC family transcriptional regulator [Trebonia sp.]